MKRDLSFILGVLVACFNLGSCAHSRRRFVPRPSRVPRYDRSISTFSAEGRLLQVEYGLEASRRGQLIAAISTSGKTCIIFSSLEKVYRIDEHIWLVAAGLTGDANALSSSLRSACQQFRISYGEAPSSKQIAQIAAELQHDLTRRGGARPIGCTALILGIDQCSSEALKPRPTMYRTTPGGVMEELSFFAAGRQQEEILKVLENEVQVLSSKELTFNLPYRFAKTLLDTSCFDADKEYCMLVLEHDFNRRGQTLATCYTRISKETVISLDSPAATKSEE